jgi:uncharacterized protein YoxC
MNKFLYAALLIGLASTTAVSAAKAPTTLKEAAKVKEDVGTALKNLQMSFGGLGSLFTDVEQLVTNLTSVTASVDTVAQNVNTELSGEYTSFDKASQDLVQSLNDFRMTDCKPNSLVCDTSNPTVNAALSELATAQNAYVAAKTALPGQDAVEGGVTTVKKAVDSIDTTDQQQLATLASSLKTSAKDINGAVANIDAILTKIETASQPTHQ